MYSSSFWAAFGLTENCSIASGQPTPMTSAVNNISTVASAGTRRSRITAPAKNATAQMIATTMRISFDGNTALMSV
ncbi:Uncharacterised protein [Mycobacteroides abscessus subsp. abscessus]|nr:Uncharacterised protein [Mycobacteroides abscessus subsp. abscessus]